MPDICDLILDDHTWFREQFAALDALKADAADADQLAAVWEPLADRLEVHAVAEEELFYPRLLEVGDDELEETEDAITDHNDITDAVGEAREHRVGTQVWWEAVDEARESNSSHTAEEDRGALPDFRANAPQDVREEIGAAWLEFHHEHKAIERDTKDPVDYTEDKAGKDKAEEMEDFIENEES